MKRIYHICTLVFSFLGLSSCRQDSPHPESKSSFLGYQDCGSMWEPKFCPRHTAITVGGDIQKNLNFQLGAFQISWRGSHPQEAQIVITHPQHPHGPIFSTLPGQTFVAFAQGKAEIEENRGSFVVEDRWKKYCYQQIIKKVQLQDDIVQLSGDFVEKGCPTQWQLNFQLEDGLRLGFDLKIDSELADPASRTFLTYTSDANERFFGFGMQFTSFDMKGRKLPIFTQEQGIGRGLQPISLGAEVTNGRGIAGDWWTSYGAVPHYISSRLRSLFLKNYEYSLFDFSQKDEVRIHVFSRTMSGSLIAGSSPLELIEQYTAYAGRMDSLPLWLDRGPVIGMQGGTDAVLSTLKILKEYDIPISAFWLQDWVGKRQTSFGSQLWWNWDLDERQYPGWAKLVSDLDQNKIKVLTYLNPFLVDVSQEDPLRRSLIEEAKNQDLLVKSKQGTVYEIPNTDFSAALLDLSHPPTREWIKGVIKEEMINIGSSGWMADFGEALPFDAALKRGEPYTYHNRYPEEWAKVNREAIEELNLWDDILFFSRSAFTRSPAYSRLFWLGDQLVSWDDRDGIKSALIGLLSSGLSGFSLNHSDTGGYTTITNPIKNYHRSKELFMRWTELNTFSSLLRTHEGNLPDENHQFDSDHETLQHFGRFARVYRDLAPYRRLLMKEAEEKGWPLVRHLFLHYPNDPEVYQLRFQFMLGSKLLMAPVLDAGKNYVDVYLPDHGWSHALTGESFEAGWHRVAAPIGKPAIFLRSDHSESWIIAEALKELRN